MIHDDTLVNLEQSEPLNIKNWFSSYEYESPVLETNDSFGFSDPQESQSYEKECSTRNTVKPIENSSELVTSEKNVGMMNKKRNQSGDENTSQNHVSDSEDSPLLSPVEESQPPGIDNWFSSYVYESPEVDTIDDLILFDYKESIINQRRAAEKDENLCVPDDLTCNQTSECGNGSTKDENNSTELSNNRTNVNSFEKAKLPSCESYWSEENASSKHDDAGNGFVSIKRKGKRENDENSVKVKCVDQKKYASSFVNKMKKGDEKTRKRTALGDITHIGHSSVTGKWKCPRKSKPNIGPPLKQLRLGQWFHHV